MPRDPAQVDDLPLHSGARQVAPTPEGVNDWHRARYRFAAWHLPSGGRILDIGCGCGYGAAVMDNKRRFITGIDHSPSAIRYARRHYGKHAAFGVRDCNKIEGTWDALVAFEIIEHLEAPDFGNWHDALRPGAPLIASVPQRVAPAADHRFHLKDWTLDELCNALRRAAFGLIACWAQTDSAAITMDAAAFDDPVAIIVKAVA